MALDTSRLITPHTERNDTKERIAARVAERDAWPTYPPLKPTKMLKFLCKNMNHFIFRNDVPSPSALDRSFPVHPMDFHRIQNPPGDRIQVTWIGHSTLLVQMGGVNVLTDPIFSRRCSAVQWAGPLRFRPPACTLQILLKEVRIDAVLITHNHYDHLDYASVKEISSLGVKFVVPLGLKAWFEKHIPKSIGNVMDMDWHESCVLNTTTQRDDAQVTVTAVPMQHMSSRKGYDMDATLWCGYTISSPTSKFLFAGDTGWFDGLTEIGQQYGPFDMAAIPIGAYEPRAIFARQHIDPEEAVRTMLALKAKCAVPIHWGTFLLTLEPVLEPRERLREAVKEAGLELGVFEAWFIGETRVS